VAVSKYALVVTLFEYAATTSRIKLFVFKAGGRGEGCHDELLFC
jgi:hypothetical protein